MMLPFELSRDQFGRLVYHSTEDGTTAVGVVPVRAFPIAAPLEGLALLSADGHELCWIDTLDQVAAPSRQLIDEELASREFLPEIRQILQVSSYATPSVWEVETDRGPARFVLKGEEDIRRVADARLLIGDSHGIQFLVRDVAALDKASRKLLDRFL